jgi:Zn-finger nucleic acid-binding protein
MSAGSISVQACQGGCGGIWFPAHQLQKAEFKNNTEGQALLNVEKNPSVQVDLNKKRNCPQCQIIMMQHYFSPKRSVVIDECPKCAGFWLDAGELNSIREEYSSESEREAAVQSYFGDVFGSALQKEHQEFESKLDKAKKAAQLFSFISPSRYVNKK